MVVALNPGAPMPDERALYDREGFTAGSCTPKQAAVLLERCTSNYLDPWAQDRGDTVFHRKSIGLVKASLWLFGLRNIDDPAWIDRCWFTDAFKCSTESERGPNIPAGAMRACRQQHLMAEFEYFKPKVVVTLGGRAAAAVGQLDDMPVVHFRFPSGGLEPLGSDSLNDNFNIVALAAGFQFDAHSRGEFAAYREALQALLFP
jgi:hypothetical protein